MRLRRRLTITMAILLILGLAVAEVLTYSSLRTFLYGQLDEQLDVASTRRTATWSTSTSTAPRRANAA